MEEIDAGYFVIIHFIWYTIYYFENKEKAENWLVKISEEKAKTKGLIQAIQFDLANMTTMDMDIWFSFFKKVKEEFLLELLTETCYDFLFACEKENELPMFFEIIGDRLTKNALIVQRSLSVKCVMFRET